MEPHQVPNGKPYRNWRAVFDDAQPLPWTAFNTGCISGALQNNAQPESFPPHRNPADRYEYAVMAFHFRHPTHGDILIDTGFDRTFHDHSPYGNISFTMRAYNTLMNVQYTQRPSDIDLMSHLKKHQIAPTVDGARGKQEVQRSATMIRVFHATYPHVQIWFSHDEDHL
jgi:hypothetical protein